MARYVATEMGIQNGGRVRPGQEFDGPEGLKGSWFEQIEEPVTRRRVKSPAQKVEPVTLGALGKEINPPGAPELA